MATPHNSTTVRSAPGHHATTNERGRKHRSNAHKPSPSLFPTPTEQDSAMGQSFSKAGAALNSRSKSRSKSTSPVESSKPEALVLDTEHVSRRGSICQSPTWSPRGSLAVRRQSDKERREQQRQQRKEADEATKRVKEEEQRRQRQKSAASSASEASSSPSLRPARRLTKQPPPAAMETQRMPTALRDSSTPQPEQRRERRSSSLSSVFRMVTGVRSRSKSRGRDASDDEAYMSDASARSSFIGGVKLKNAQVAVSPKPQIDDSAIRRDSVDFSTQVHAQMDSITAQAKLDAAVLDRKAGPSNEAFRPTADALGTHDATEMAPESAQQPTTKAKRMNSVRLASMNRMQNLVIPLRSAMKGGRETAAAGRAQTMPSFSPHTQHMSPQLTSGDYVRRSRLRDHARSMAGWQDEMAIQEANDQAAVNEAKQDGAAPGEVAQAKDLKPAYGPRMPPTPDASRDTLPRRSKDSDEKSQNPIPAEAEKSPVSPASPGDMDHVVWKQPIRANKLAAASRVDGHQGLAEPKAEELPLDIDTLPSQKQRQFPLFPPQKSTAIKTSTDSQARQGAPKEQEQEKNTPRERPRDASSPDATDHGLKRQPAVMSWKAEKDKNGKVLSSSPRSPTLVASPTESIKVPPEHHPSLAALRGEVGSPVPARPASNIETSTAEQAETLAAPLERPFSIVPTPVASPMPGDLITMTPPKPARALAPIRRHSTPVETIEEERKGAKEKPIAASTTNFPFPDRHVTLRKPEKRETETGDGGRPDSDKENAGKGGSGKVTFHTPPESPRYANVSTSYDAYRRPYSTTKVSPVIGTSEIDESIELPVSVADLGKPNPPFAQEGKTSSGKKGSRENSSSPRRSANRASDSFVYLPFSPSASSSSVNLAGKPRGFKLKNTDGSAYLDFKAKIFVICCGCKKWHDIPSSLYKEMGKGMRDIDSQKDGVAEARLPTRGDEEEASRERKRRQPKRSGVLATVPCCWCEHQMSTLCCEGWTTVCYKHVQHHPAEDKEEPASRSSSARARPSKHHD